MNIKLKRCQNFHHEAMRLADEAIHLRRLRDKKGFAQRTLQAFEKERRAAEMVASDLGLEPTRSVLHRSAAVLAIECGKLREAERLIAVALSGNPPEFVAEQLRDLLFDVYSGKSSQRKRRPFSKTAQVV